jgi:hypothetical protein
MKKWIIAVLAITVAGCSTNPTNLKPVKDKYTFQALYISLSATDADPSASSFATTQAVSGFHSSDESVLPMSFPQPYTQEEIEALSISMRPSQEEIEALLKKPNAEIIEFPIVYAGIGETVTNAQTEVFQSVLDASVVEGKVVYETEPINVGTSTSLTINKVLESGAINCDLEIYHCRLTGVDHYTLEEKFDVEIPYFEIRSVNTEITLNPNSWLTMGGLISQHDDGTKTQSLIYVRVLPPKS